MPATTRRRLTQQERVEESAKLLVEAAIELIAEKGFERTAASEIADRAGYSRTMVQARFGSKENLLEHIMRTEYEPRMLPDLGTATGIDRLLLWIDEIRTQNRTEPILMRAFYTLIYESVGPVPSLRAWTSQWIKRCIDEAAGTFREGQAAKTIRRDIDPEAEAERFVSAGLGLGLRYLVSDDPDGFDEALSRWADHFERARAR